MNRTPIRSRMQSTKSCAHIVGSAGEVVVVARARRMQSPRPERHIEDAVAARRSGYGAVQLTALSPAMRYLALRGVRCYVRPSGRRIADYVSLKSAVHVAPRLAVTASMIGRAALFWRARSGPFPSGIHAMLAGSFGEHSRVPVSGRGARINRPTAASRAAISRGPRGRLLCWRRSVRLVPPT
jgi:hypothetical protein